MYNEDIPTPVNAVQCAVCDKIVRSKMELGIRRMLRRSRVDAPSARLRYPEDRKCVAASRSVGGPDRWLEAGRGGHRL